MLALLLLLSISAFGAELCVVTVRATDGNTIVVKVGYEQHRIRLSGVDAPEAPQAFGKRVPANLAGLVEGRWVAVVWSKKDGYGRPFGTSLLGSINVNASQIQAGCAWYFRRYSADLPEIERVQYEPAEAEARESKRGLWQQQQAIPLRQKSKTDQAALAAAASNSVMASSGEKEPLWSLYWQI